MKELEQIVRLAQCSVIHMGYPPGTTCLDVAALASDPKNAYADQFRQDLLAGKHFCTMCRIADLAMQET